MINIMVCELPRGLDALSTQDSAISGLHPAFYFVATAEDIKQNSQKNRKKPDCSDDI